jgi:hypothetical protein
MTRKKHAWKKRDSAKSAVVIATQKVAVPALDRRKKNTTPARRRAPAALGCHDPATPNAQAATPPSHRTSLALWRWILVRDVSFEGAAWFFFLCGVEQTPVFVWRVVVVGGLCARRREVQIWCGDGPRCGHFT